MNDQSDQLVSKRLREILDEDLRTLDPKTAAALTAARRRALERARPRRRPLLEFAPAAAFASVVVVMLVLLHDDPLDHSVNAPADQLVLELGEEAFEYHEIAAAHPDLTDKDIELIEDLEFFEWLEATGYAG